MNPADVPFVPLVDEAGPSDFVTLTRRPALASLHADAPEPRDDRSFSGLSAPSVARLTGFDLLDQPLVTGVTACPGEVLCARSTVALRQAQIGRDVLLIFLGGDPRQPVILGVIEPTPRADPQASGSAQAAASFAGDIAVDGERCVLQAEREVVLRCGDASITLTRAGKVIIEGRYILSRSSGYNRIKGAAVDIN